MTAASSLHTPFLAFASAAGDIETLRKFAITHQWPDSCIYQGDIRTATDYLKNNPSPALLLVEIPSAQEAPALLDALAEFCNPDTKVIIIGSVNEYSFYCWLTEIGIFSYLLKPLTDQSLEGAYLKSVEKPAAAKQEREPGKIIAVMGTRGGVGSTTVAINLAGIIADLSKKETALIDTDPQEGSVALTLDLDPSRGFREALEKPDRIDSLFVERVMTKPLKHLSILSSEESLQDKFTIHDLASEALLKEMRDKFDVIVLDIPRYLNAFSRKCLGAADHVVLVTELTLLSLRDTLRLADLMRESLKMKPPVIVANRVGMASKYEVKKADFEKGIGADVKFTINYVPEMFMQVSADIPVIKFKSHSAAKPYMQLAGELIPEAKSLLASVKEKKGGLFKKKEKLEAGEEKADKAESAEAPREEKKESKEA